MAPRAFDLDRFAPEPVTFTVDGVDYVLPGDPDVDIVGRMLRIEETIREASNRSNVEEIAAATREGKQLLLEMILDHDVDQDVAALKLGTTQVLTLFALILHGGSVAAVVARALTASTEELGEDTDGVATPEAGASGDLGDGEGSPLALASVSSARSSSSEDTADGLPATGLG